MTPPSVIALAKLYQRLEEWTVNDDGDCIKVICEDVMPTLESTLIAEGFDMHRLSLLVEAAGDDQKSLF